MPEQGNNLKSRFKQVIFEMMVPLFVILMALLLIFGILVQGSEEMAFYQPTGYIKKIQALVNQGIVKYDRKHGRIAFNEKIASQNIKDFYNQSYLKEDIDLFNGGNYLGIFNITEGKIKLDIRARQVQLPYTAVNHWTGDLFYRDISKSAILGNDRLHLQILPAPGNILPLRSNHYEFAPVQQQNGFYSHYGILLKHDIRKYFTQLEYIGDDVVLGVKRQPPYLSVNYIRIPVGNYLRLQDGDVISFYDDKGYNDYLLFREKGSVGLISSTRNINGDFERVYFSNALDTFPMVESFCSGLQRIVAAQRPGKTEKKIDIALTVDRNLHQVIQAELLKFIKKTDGNKGLNYYPAAVTLMDTDTGEILALASYPDPQSMEILAYKLQKQRRKQSYILRLALNQNLLNHTIGSAVKPMLASAIWMVHPYLSNFKIINHPPGNELDYTLGLSLDKPFEIFQHPEKVIDRHTFFKYSCNLYMVNLFLLGLASDHDKTLSYTSQEIPPVNSIGENEIRNAVDFSGYLKSDINTFVNLERSPIVGALGNIFDIEIKLVDSNNVRENTASKYDTELLESISQKLGLENKFDLKPMYSCCPDQVNLRFNQVQLLRSEFISLDFGGASSEWNNIKLAESISRIVTGKKIKAKLIMAVLDDKERSRTFLTGYKKEETEKKGMMFETFSEKENTALQWVREGIRLVTTKGGTADKLCPFIEEINNELMGTNLRITVYSKTGSPRKYDKGPNSAVYLFSIILEKQELENWVKVGGITGAIYIENRGMSALAVEFATHIFKTIVDYLINKSRLGFSIANL